MINSQTPAFLRAASSFLATALKSIFSSRQRRPSHVTGYSSVGCIIQCLDTGSIHFDGIPLCVVSQDSRTALSISRRSPMSLHLLHIDCFKRNSSSVPFSFFHFIKIRFFKVGFTGNRVQMQCYLINISHACCYYYCMCIRTLF